MKNLLFKFAAHGQPIRYLQSVLIAILILSTQNVGICQETSMLNQSECTNSDHLHPGTHHKKDNTDYVDVVFNNVNKDYFEDDDHQLWKYYLNKEHPKVAEIEKYFNQASEEFSVPVELLKVIGQIENNWTQIGPSIDRGWGIMHLVDNDYSNTLEEAATLLAVSKEVLKDDAKQNIRGGAALLSKYYSATDEDENEWLRWFDAAKEFSALLNDELKTMQANRYFSTLKNGISSKTVWDELVTINAKPLLQIPQMNNQKSVESTDYPQAMADFTTCNYSSGRNHSIDAWVNHWIGLGTYYSAISTFQNCSENVSAHFVIKNDGEISQVVRVANTAWHCGSDTSPYNNGRSIGIEHEATAANPGLWNSEAMLQASADMACYFTDLYNIPTTRSLPGIRQHNEMPGEAGTTECAGNLPWDNWMGKLNACSGGNAPTPPNLITPLNTATNITTPINFDWSTVSGADAYRICVSTSPSGFNSNATPMFPNSLVNQPGNGGFTSYNWSGAQPNTTYYWAVRVNHPTNGIATSQVYSFTTQATCTTDSSEPNNSVGQADYVGAGTSYTLNNMCLTAGDNDYFRFYANGQNYYVRVRGYNTTTTGQYRLRYTRSGNTLTIETQSYNGSSTDTYLHLYDANGTTQLTSDDDSGSGYFSKIIYTIPSSGCTTDSSEPNNSTAQADYVGSGTSHTLNNMCLTAGDNDYFRFYANGQHYYVRVRGYVTTTTGQYRLRYTRSGNTLTIETQSYNGSSTDTYLHLYDANGTTQLASDDDSGSGHFSKIIYTIPVPSITVTNPNSSTTWIKGQTYTIQWNDNVPDNVVIRLYRSSSYVASITGSTASDGSYTYAVPTNLTGATNYRVRIYSTASSSISDYSDYFTIEDGSSSCETPDGLYAYGTNSTTTNLTWNNVIGASSYYLYYWNGSWIYMGNTTGSNVVISGMSPGNTYCFAVAANCSGTVTYLSYHVCITTAGGTLRTDGSESVELDLDNIQYSEDSEQFENIRISEEGIGVETISNVEATVIPNPVRVNQTSQIAFESKTTGTATINIVDMTGRTIYQNNIEVINGENQIDLEPFDMPGVYFVSIGIKSDIKTAKLVVLK